MGPRGGQPADVYTNQGLDVGDTVCHSWSQQFIIHQIKIDLSYDLMQYLFLILNITVYFKKDVGVVRVARLF